MKMINYYLLTKPGIILGNLVTLAAGFLLASRDGLDLSLFFATLAGLVFIIASACVLNNVLDKELDRKMERTKNRVLVQGLIPETHAVLFGVILSVIGNLILFLFTNILTVFLSDLGLFVYLFLYSLWKGHTIYGTAIGSVAGAMPPVIGYSAASDVFDAGAVVLFFMMILWQMPHFFSIALYHLEDYSKAKVPVLPVMRGIWRTKVHMFLYILCFIPAALLLVYFNYTGTYYFIAAASIGLVWLGVSLSGFRSKDHKQWGKWMFRLSLLMINIVCLGIFFDLKH